MFVATTAAAWRKWRSENPGALALAPTMGGLHDGHLSLLRRARQTAKWTAASIFVNPKQFGAGEDFAVYPRAPEEDLAKLRGLADAVFMPGEKEMYPEKELPLPPLPPLAKELCGKSRPEFFGGVAAAVFRLFDILRPNVAVFGKKDLQQAHIVAWLINEMNFEIQLELAPIVREADGLAMSSRNAYLTDEERKRAPALHRALRRAAAAVNAGGRDFAALEKEGEKELQSAGFVCDYFKTRRADNLSMPRGDEPAANLVMLAAAHLGQARLIDNVAAACAAKNIGV